MDISKELANANKIVPASATADSSPMGTMQTTDWAAGGNKKAIPNTTYEFDPYASSSSSTNTSSYTFDPYANEDSIPKPTGKPSSEIYNDYEHAAPISDVANASLSTEPRGMIKKYAKAYGQDEKDFIIDPKGNILRATPGDLDEQGNQKYARIIPDVSKPGGLSRYLASGVGSAIPGLFGTAGAIAGSALPLVGTAAVAGAAGGAGELVREYADKSYNNDWESAQPDYGNVAAHTLANAAGPFIGAGLVKGANAILPSTLTEGLTQGQQAIKAAQDAGFVIPPEMLKDSPQGLWGKMLNVFGGKSATMKAAQEANAAALENGIKQELGINANTPLTQEALNAIKEQNIALIDNIGNLGSQYKLPINKTSNSVAELNKILEPTTETSPELGAHFKAPERVQSLVSDVYDSLSRILTPKEVISNARELNKKAAAAYKANDIEMGRAYAAAADMYDNLLDENLTKYGFGDSLATIKNARAKIAQANTVKGILDENTGYLDIGKLADKATNYTQKTGLNPSYTGKLKDMVEATQRFKDAIASSKAVGASEHEINPLVLDSALTFLYSHPKVAVPIAAGTAARSFAARHALSDSIQNSLITPKAIPALSDEVYNWAKPAATPLTDYAEDQTNKAFGVNR